MTHKTLTLLSALALLGSAAASVNCSGHGSGAGGTGASGAGGSATGPMFQPDSPKVYVAKVKNILVGLPPTDAEIQQVTADPTQLASLIDGWMKLPQYSQKMMKFFELAFQQTQITEASFVDMLPPNGIGRGVGLPGLIQNVEESFARTVLELVAEGQPLTAAMTTKRVMMTTSLMEFYAMLDTYHVDDNAKPTDSLYVDYPQATKIVQGTAGMSNITISQSADPTSPYFMQWYNPDIALIKYGQGYTGCSNLDPITTIYDSYALHWILYGMAFNHNVPGTMQNCFAVTTKDGNVFSANDYADWRMVTIRPPNANEKTTKFFDIPALRTQSELVIRTPRPGFFSTPAFFANWSTNQSNQMRVTLNQALIVATGAAVDGTDPTMPTSTPGLDTTHAQPGTACVSCHQTLDPTRAILSSTWTYAYYTQKDPTQIAQKGLFAFQGVIKDVSTIDDFANILATHPLFASAWAKKLYYYANSYECPENNPGCLDGDPEFQRIVTDFKNSNYNWNTLVREMLSSPLTTNASPTSITQNGGELAVVSRRDHLCAALNNRLGYTDICGLDVNAPPTTIQAIVSGLPSDGYGRGSTLPVLPNQPTLFYRAGLENICEAVAQMVIDGAPDPKNPNAKRWSSGSPDSAIADFVSIIMAVEPSDSRSAQAVTLLKAHFMDTMQMQGASASDALKSTFTAACLAPSAAGIGL